MDACIQLQNVRNVAIIGAGISGIVSAVHLLREGIDVTNLERGRDFGSAWKYSLEPDRDAFFPSIKPPSYACPKLGDERKGVATEEIASTFAPPGPVYASLKSRGSSNIMWTSLMSWPDGTEDYMGRERVLVCHET